MAGTVGAESPDRGEPSGRDGRLTWLDEDDFGGLGEEAWLTAMESLAAAEPEPGAPVRDDLVDTDPGDENAPVLGFGPGDAGESMAPGVSLSLLAEHVVAGGCLPVMSDFEVVGLIAAARRLRRRAEWLELRGTREFASRRWEASASPVRDEDGRWLFRNSDAEHAADELAFELKDSRVAAEDRMELSLALRDRLPRLDALLAAGLLDERRVAGVRDITSGLDDEQVRRVDDLLSPDAPDLPYTALRRRAAKLAISLSPESETRRKKTATRRKARVEKFQERSGNYALAARELPAEEALASEGYIRAMAVYLRSHGVDLGQREAELMCYLDLTQGRDPLDRIPADRREPGGAAPRPAPTGGADHDGGSGGGRDGEPGSGERDGREDEGWQWDQWDDYDDEEDEDGDGDGGNGGDGPWPFGPPGSGGRAPFAASINLLVPVGTAFGWSGRPGEAGRDIIDPQTLREMMQAASRHPATRWCVTLTGEDGTAVAHGCARGRHTWDPPPDAREKTGIASTTSRTGDGTVRPGQALASGQPSAPGPVPAPAQLDRLAEFLARLRLDFKPIATDTCDHRQAEPRYRPSRATGRAASFSTSSAPVTPPAPRPVAERVPGTRTWTTPSRGRPARPMSATSGRPAGTTTAPSRHPGGRSNSRSRASSGGPPHLGASTRPGQPDTTSSGRALPASPGPYRRG